MRDSGIWRRRDRSLDRWVSLGTLAGTRRRDCTRGSHLEVSCRLGREYGLWDMLRAYPLPPSCSGCESAVGRVPRTRIGHPCGSVRARGLEEPRLRRLRMRIGTRTRPSGLCTCRTTQLHGLACLSSSSSPFGGPRRIARRGLAGLVRSSSIVLLSMSYLDYITDPEGIKPFACT
jgi:hypothetical protein